jgi:hypothetical protein
VPESDVAAACDKATGLSALERKKQLKMLRALRKSFLLLIKIPSL